LADITVSREDQASVRGRRVRSFISLMRRWPVSSIVIISLLVFTGIFAPWLAPEPERFGEIRNSFEKPAILGGDSRFILGTDQLGRDILSRILFGARISLLISVIVVVISGTFGTVMGLISAWYGGWVDEIIMRLVDGINAMPIITVALVLAVVFGPSFGLLIFILAIGSWPGYARVVRGEALVVRKLDYVASARIAGASTPRILFRHLLPGVINVTVVVATLSLSSVILAEAGLSFLGIGVPAPTPSWGGMVSDGRDFLTTAWWVSVFPGIAIAVTVVAFVLLGDWLRDRFDPRLRQL
jgi:peptide/nickel transport system permease protein